MILMLYTKKGQQIFFFKKIKVPKALLLDQVINENKKDSEIITT